ncbi:MAG: response regulator transcription factor [Geminicoccaceae bacterium]
MNDQQIIDGQEGDTAHKLFDAWQLSTNSAVANDGSKKALIVDDDKLFCCQLSAGLKRYGLEVIPTDNRQMALEAAQSHRPQFAVLELRLNHDPSAIHSGLEAISSLRRQHRSMRIVVATAYSSIVSAVEAIKAGASDYLLKPTDVDSVAAALMNSRPMPGLPKKPMGADRLRWEYILRVLFQCEQNVSATARALGMHRRTLQRMLNKRPPPE